MEATIASLSNQLLSAVVEVFFIAAVHGSKPNQNQGQ